MFFVTALRNSTNQDNCNFYMYFMMYLEAKGTLKRISNGVRLVGVGLSCDV